MECGLKQGLKRVTNRLRCLKKKKYIWLLLELVSKELTHLAAILHVYAGGFDFYEVKKEKREKKQTKNKQKKNVFQKENGNTSTLLVIL